MTGLISSCGEEPFIGKMSISTICSTTGYIIRQNLGTNFKTIGVKCTVAKVKNKPTWVRVRSSYISPLGPTLKYTAFGNITGDALELLKIKVHGIDKKFIPFAEFSNKI